MNRQRFKALHRAARLGALGTLATTTSNAVFQWLLHEVYDLRFPHVGEDRRRVDDLISGVDFNGQCRFNSHCCGGTTQKRLAAWHHARGWINCGHKSLLRLWVEKKAMMARRTFTDELGIERIYCPAIGTWIPANPLRLDV